MLFYQGFAVAIVSVAAPWIGTSFHLDGSGIARLFAWISLSALGALALSRMIDRYGRRRMILWCMAAIPVCSIGAAVSSRLIWFAIFQIGLYAVVGAAGSGCVVMLSEELPIARRARGQSFGGLAASVGAGLCVFLMPIFDAYGWSWRWMFVISAVGIAMLPAMARLLPESGRWQLSDAVGNQHQDAFLRRLSAALSQTLDHDDRMRARRRNLDHRRERIRLLSCCFSGRHVGDGDQHHDHRRRRTGIVRLSTRRMERRAIRPCADSGRLRNRNHRRTPMVLLGTAVAFRVALDVAVDGLLLVQRYATTAAPSRSTQPQPNCSRLLCAAR